jgi:hypothetical protein
MSVGAASARENTPDAGIGSRRGRDDDTAVLSSELFFGDALLQAIADDRDRISRNQHPTDPAVLKLQTALLVWDPDCLPVSGADGIYEDETAAAVVRFKIEVIGVSPDAVIDDVGPRTVITLDGMLPSHGLDPQLREALRVVLGDPDSASIAALRSELARQGITLAPGELAAVMAQLLAS